MLPPTKQERRMERATGSAGLTEMTSENVRQDANDMCGDPELEVNPPAEGQQDRPETSSKVAHDL